jgi:cytochrome c553
MRRFLVAVFVLALPLAHAGTRAVQAQAPAAAPVGTADAGKAHWALGNTSCRNCHGGDGEGAFAPALAGRNFTYEKFRAYVRNPMGRMPGYLPSELTDQEIADMVAYFNSLPKPAKASEWRVKLPEHSVRGQDLAVAMIGCGQCHGETVDTPRHGMAEVTGDFEWFKSMVYDHVAAQKKQWSELDPNLPRTTPGPAGPPGRNRVRMGNYSRAKLPESTLKEIYDWAIDLGRLAPLSGQITPGTGGTYTVKLTNAGVKGRGITVEDIDLELIIPSGLKVVSATGAKYEGVRHSEEAKGDVAAWRIASLAAGEQATMTVTLSAPSTTGLKVIGKWARPAVKADGELAFQLAAPGGRGGRGGE